MRVYQICRNQVKRLPKIISRKNYLYTLPNLYKLSKENNKNYQLRKIVFMHYQTCRNQVTRITKMIIWEKLSLCITKFVEIK